MHPTLRQRFTLNHLRDRLGVAAAQRRDAIAPGTFRLLVGTSALAAALAMAVFVFTGTHQAGFLTFNALGHQMPELLLANLTELGNTAVLVAIGVVAARAHPQFFLALVIAVLLGAVLISGAKDLFAVLRPPAVLAPESFRLIGEAHQRGSFPSGHSFATFSVAAVALAFMPGRPARLSLLLGAMLISSARVWVGVHWPLDLLGGAVGGLLTGAAALALSQRWSGGYHPAWHLAMVWLAVISNLVLLRDGTNYALADPLMRTVAAASTIALAWQYFHRGERELPAP